MYRIDDANMWKSQRYSIEYSYITILWAVDVTLMDGRYVGVC